MPKVEIVIRKKRRRIATTSVRRGPLDRRREPEYLPRRGGKGIVFYDLGYRRTGEDGALEDLPFDAEQTVITNSSGGISTGGNFPTEAQMTAMRDVIFDVAESEWPDIYYKIKRDDTISPVPTTEKFVVTVVTPAGTYPVSSSDRWNDDRGMRMTANDLTGVFRINTNSIHHTSFFLAGPFQNHITAVLDPDAPSVDFVPSNRMDVYLAPRLTTIQASTNHVGSGPAVVREMYISGRRVHYRDVLLNGAAYEDPPTSGSLTAWRVRIASLTYQLDKLAESTRVGSSYTWAITFPVPPIDPPFGDFDSISVTHATSGTGRDLVAVVKKAGQTFYVWG